MHRGHEVLILGLLTAPSAILPYSEGKAKRGGTRVSPSRERETRLPQEPGLQLPLTLPTESHQEQNPLKGTKTMRAERGASLPRTRGGRLTQPGAGQRRLSGECLSPQPGVRPKLKKPSSLNQPPRRHPPSPPFWVPPGPQSTRPHPRPRRGSSSASWPSTRPRGLQHFLPICFRSVLTVRMLSRVLSRTHFLCLFLSLPLLSLSLFTPCLILCCSFQWRKIIILLNGFARGARTHERAHTHPAEVPNQCTNLRGPFNLCGCSGS